MTAPYDIRMTARELYDQLGRGALTDERTIAAALLAERERCAKIADPIVTNRKGKLSTDMRTPADIAAAIRS